MIHVPVLLSYKAKLFMEMKKGVSCCWLNNFPQFFLLLFCAVVGRSLGTLLALASDMWMHRIGNQFKGQCYSWASIPTVPMAWPAV